MKRIRHKRSTEFMAQAVRLVEQTGRPATVVAHDDERCSLGGSVPLRRQTHDDRSHAAESGNFARYGHA
jgi:hypothetical protein